MYLTVSRPKFPGGSIACNIDQWFDEFFGNRTMADNQSGWIPRADVHENDNSFIVHLDLPGVDKNDVKVKFEDDTLVVSGERKQESTTDEKNFHRVERVYGSFTRSISLPKQVNAEKVSATFKNGVLEINLPKTEEVKPKEIEIKVG